jgi:hypothetical protein
MRKTDKYILEDPDWVFCLNDDIECTIEHKIESINDIEHICRDCGSRCENQMAICRSVIRKFILI